MSGPGILLDRSGAAAFEMALILPLVLMLLFGGFEAGNFIWTQHKLTEAVRNGTRYASRLAVEDYCGPGGSGGAAIANIKLVTRTGQLVDATATPHVPGWSSDQVAVDVDCNSFVDTGIYTDLGEAGPIVTVEAQGVAYPSLFGRLGVIDPSITMTAKSSAAVTGL